MAVSSSVRRATPRGKGSGRRLAPAVAPAGSWAALHLPAAGREGAVARVCAVATVHWAPGHSHTPAFNANVPTCPWRITSCILQKRKRRLRWSREAAETEMEKQQVLPQTVTRLPLRRRGRCATPLSPALPPAPQTGSFGAETGFKPSSGGRERFLGAAPKLGPQGGPWRRALIHALGPQLLEHPRWRGPPLPPTGHSAMRVSSAF